MSQTQAATQHQCKFCMRAGCVGECLRNKYKQAAERWSMARKPSRIQMKMERFKL